MTRFNYLAPARRWRLGSAPHALAIDKRIRGPLTALLATVGLTAVVCFVQLERFHAAGRDYARAAALELAARPAADAVLALRARVARDAGLVAEIDAFRAASLARADELAWIGNQLPAHVWLRSLRYDNGSYELDGVSDRTPAVGAALLALRDSQRGTRPELVSLHTDRGIGPPVNYRLHLQTDR